MNTDEQLAVTMLIATAFIIGALLHKTYTELNTIPKAKAGDRIKITGGVEYEGLPLKGKTYFIYKVVKYKDAPSEYIIHISMNGKTVTLLRNKFVIYK